MPKTYNVLGLMSGTSLDGLDMALVKLVYNGSWRYEILHAETLNYTHQWVGRLREALHLSHSQLDKLDQEYTEFLAEAVVRFRERHSLPIDLIASHGHTVHHRPEEGVTVQIGNRPELATKTALTTVCDFRVQDVQLGGQGAPLVPMGDRLLFAEYDYCINLGGFANISYEQKGKRTAFDICPVNVVLNRYAEKLGQDYDVDGAFAKAGTVNLPLLEKLNSLDFYNHPPPKSLGMEWVEQYFLPLISDDLAEKDVLATVTEHVAQQISRVTDSESIAMFTGGGAKNAYLMQRIQQLCGLHIADAPDTLIDFKEALVFALLGVLRFRESDNILSSVTGAAHDHSSGRIFHP